VKLPPLARRLAASGAWRLRLKSWRESADAFFFGATGPYGLALVRIVFFGFVAGSVSCGNLADWADAPAELWKPVLSLAWLSGPINSAAVLALVQWGLAASCVACCLGLWFRPCAVATVPLGLLHFGLPNCFGKINHCDTLTVFAFLILALSNAASVWSIDGWQDRRRGIAPPIPSGEFQWPLRLLQVLFALVMCAAGVAKLRVSGLAWVLSENLQYTVIRMYYSGDPPPLRIGLVLAQIPWLCQVLAAGSLLIELTAPIALFSRRYRWFVIPSLIGMQLGIYLLMGIAFPHYLLLYVVWVEWNEVFVGMGSRGSATNPSFLNDPHVEHALQDGDRRSSEWLAA
jgi:hypothetical protein